MPAPSRAVGGYDLIEADARHSGKLVVGGETVGGSVDMDRQRVLRNRHAHLVLPQSRKQKIVGSTGIPLIIDKMIVSVAMREGETSATPAAYVESAVSDTGVDQKSTVEVQSVGA